MTAAPLLSRRLPLAVMLAVPMVGLSAAPAMALDREHRERAERTIDKAIEYLRSVQNDDGSWSPDPGPAVTALVTAGMLADPDIDRTDTTVRRALDYIMSRQKEDGGIYDQILANYNTSIALMALGQVRNADPKYREAVQEAQDFLRNLQWSQNREDPRGETIERDHPWYGGAGYGNSGRPDLSNTATMVAGLRDSGLVCTDPAYQRAMTFISRLQGSEANEKYGDQIQQDGGFIYATSHNKDSIGKLQSYAEPATVEDDQGKSRLRTYGSMTYAGFMSFLYAKLDRDDPRVRDALGWVRRNYTLEENPGTGMQGYYYYLHLFARAMSAWGYPKIETADGEKHDWANELIDKLAELQREDGSFLNTHQDRWMEDDPNLCTAYALLALQHALQ
jgi:squalene-hopene/tetraprenyl-beta-curcumene cyclase